MKLALVIAALLVLAVPAAAHVPECYEHIERRSNDGTTNKSGSMYTTSMIRNLIWAMVQELPEDERRKARTLEQIASVIGPCLLPDGTIFHMVDRPIRRDGERR